jgi:hypothetical protein
MPVEKEFRWFTISGFSNQRHKKGEVKKAKIKTYPQNREIFVLFGLQK